MNDFTADLTVAGVTRRFAVTAVPTCELPRWEARLLQPLPDGAFAPDPSARVVSGLTAAEVVGVMAGIVAAGALADAAAGLRSVAAPAAVTTPLVRPATPIRPAPVVAPEIEPVATPAVAPAQDSAAHDTAAPVSFASPEDRPADMKAAIEQAVERLAEQLAAGHTAGFLAYLRFAARFHRYSVNNQLLIMLQNPEATLVAGMRRWNEQGWRVRKGETALFVWCPITRKVRDAATGEVEEELVGFRPGPVFDVSQLANLDDKPLPTPFAAQPDDVEGLYREIAERIRADGITVEERALPAGVRGASAGGRIALAPGMGSRERVQVLVHEAVHELGGHHTEEGRAKGRQALELEAEATTFVVCAVLGLDAPAAADYLLNWEGDAAQLRASLGTIQRLTKTVLGVVMPGEGARMAA